MAKWRKACSRSMIISLEPARHPHAEIHQALNGVILIGFEDGKQLTAIDGVVGFQCNKAVEKRPLLFIGERTLTTQQHPERQFESFLPDGDTHKNLP